MFTFPAVVTGIAFTVLSIRNELKLPVESLSFNSLSVVFRVGASLALLGAAAPLAEAAFLQLEDAIYGAACGRGDLVFEEGRV